MTRRWGRQNRTPEPGVLPGQKHKVRRRNGVPVGGLASGAFAVTRIFDAGTMIADSCGGIRNERLGVRFTADLRYQEPLSGPA